MKLPKSLQTVVDSFESLPGIGPKTAQRLAFYLLRLPKHDVLKFSDSLKHLKEGTNICEDCFNVCDKKKCEVCLDTGRDKSVICVVESPLDVLALERSKYNGLYHVLHGVINPIAGIGPEEIFIEQLFDRLKGLSSINEVILATSTSLEGEATSMYIYKELKKINNVKVTRIGKGLPIGADIEYADEGTLSDAMRGRIVYDN